MTTDRPNAVVIGVSRKNIVLTTGKTTVHVTWGDMRQAASPGNYFTGAHRMANPESHLCAEDRAALDQYRDLLRVAREMADRRGLRADSLGPNYEVLERLDPDQVRSESERQAADRREMDMLRGRLD